MSTSNEPASDTTTATREARMTAVVLDRFGGIDELTLRETSAPEVGPEDVLVRVEYAGIGSWDAEEREGDYDEAFGVASPFPYVLGWDAAGSVAAVGDAVTRFAKGDRVYAATTPVPRGGFYAEYGVASAEHVAPVPDRMTTEAAGALAWDAATALSGLDALDLGPGRTLMVFGASGGIGHLAVQLARAAGVRVLAVASGDDGVALARRLGADVVVDGRREDVAPAAAVFAPDGVDAALVTAGGAAAEAALRSVRPSGRIAWPNGVGPTPESWSGAPITHYDGDPGRATTDRLNALVEAGALEVHVERTFPMTAVRDAHEALRSHHIGKFVLRVD